MDLLMPQLGLTMTEGTVTAWRKRVGEAVVADEILFEVSTDKAEIEIPAPVGGVLAEIVAAAGETVAVGARIGVLAEAGAAKPGASASDKRDARGKPLSPAVRRLIAAHKLDAAAIEGSGADGRITRRDVLAAIGEDAPESPPEAEAGSESEVVPLSRIRRRIGAHMQRSVATSPHVLQAIEVDFHNVESLRRAEGAAWRAREGFGLTGLPFVALAAAAAIADFPHVNARIDGDDLILHRRVDLGIAVDLGFEGLVVPVVRDAGARTLADVARAIADLAARARGRRLSPDELAGGTYTLSNSGAYGTLITAPIINQPQVAILSIDGVRKKPVAVETADGDAIAIRPVGVLAQCFDHRAFDGAYSAAFLRRVGEILETRDWPAELARG